MSQPFRFKHFTITQNQNPQKVGTDSMLLGAWSKGNFKQILDIGTGTGILALMLAQQNPDSKITAIEPEPESLQEAELNFTTSPFSKQITAIQSDLQTYSSDKKFDLIISNPPYFENSTLSEDGSKNRARHTHSLSVEDLYKYASRLLEPNGFLNLIFPFDMETIHFAQAEKFNLHPAKILRTKREDGLFVRTLVSYSFEKRAAVEEEMIVKYADNRYSQEYIEVTKEFYGVDLGAKSLDIGN